MVGNFVRIYAPTKLTLGKIRFLRTALIRIRMVIFKGIGTRVTRMYMQYAIGMFFSLSRCAIKQNME